MVPCSICGVGWYKTGSVCTACPTCWAHAMIGATSVNDFCVCYYGAAGVPPSCKACPTGYTTSATASTAASACILCAPGYSKSCSTGTSIRKYKCGRPSIASIYAA